MGRCIPSSLRHHLRPHDQCGQGFPRRARRRRPLSSAKSGPLDGHITQTWETEMLRALKRHGAVIGPIEIAGKFDGFSETWTRE